MHVTPLNYEFRTKIRRFKYETGNSQLWPSQPVRVKTGLAQNRTEKAYEKFSTDLGMKCYMHHTSQLQAP